MWIPELRTSRGPRYLAIVDAMSEDIRNGRLGAGMRLPTQRELGKALGVALGTITRAYAEAERRGLVRGEVGRGTFVRERRGAVRPPTQTVPSSGLIDLSVNLPVYSEDPDLGEALARLSVRPDLGPLLHYQAHAGMARHREAGARWTARFGVEASPESVLVCAGTQNALTVALSSLSEPGDLIFTEELTYSGVKAVARHLNLHLEGLAMDERGLLPDALAAAARRRRAKALYLIPTIHNPTSASLDAERRRAIVAIAAEHDLMIVEDDADRLLADDAPPPLTALAPERGYFVASMSKAVSGGLRIAFLAAPPSKVERLSREIWATHWMVAPLMAEIAALWIDDGTAERVMERKRAEAAARQRLAREILRGVSYRAHPNGYHLWLELPAPWKSAELVAEAYRRGVAVSPAEAFVVGDRPAPAAVRVCLGAPEDRETVRAGLSVLARLLAGERGFGTAIV